MGRKRLDTDRQDRLQPFRIGVAIEKITSLGYDISFQDTTKIEFAFNGNKITFFPYSGWHTGKGIKDGRGLDNLLKQIQP